MEKLRDEQQKTTITIRSSSHERRLHARRYRERERLRQELITAYQSQQLTQAEFLNSMAQRMLPTVSLGGLVKKNMAYSIDQSAASKNMNLLLIGWPGNGKSATGNSILGHKAFHTSNNFNRPATECPQAQTSTYNCYNLTVVDGVDLAAKRDSKQSDDPTHFSTLSRAEQLCPDGFHAILFVAKYGEKYSQNEAEIVNIVQSYFGEDLVRSRSICIITHADNYAHAKDNKKFTDFADWCLLQTQEFRQLLKTCNSRFVLFDNLTKDKNIKKQQRDQLVSLLSTLPSMSSKDTKMPDQTPLSRTTSREPDYKSGVGNPMGDRDSRRRQEETDDGSGRDGQTPVKSLRSDPSPAQSNADLCLLLLGASGNGRSSTGNSILGKRTFNTMNSTNENDETNVDKGVSVQDGRRIFVVDGPGIDVDDSKNFTNMDRIIKGIQRALEFCEYRFSALIFTIRYGHRFTKKEIEAVKMIKSVLGHDVLSRYGICVMTYGDDFNREAEDARERDETLTFEDWCSAQSGETMKLFLECRQRCVLFDNTTRDPQKKQHQVMKLLSLVSGESYTMQQYANAEREREQLLFEAKLPELERETSQVLEEVRHQMGDIMAVYFDQPVTQKQELEKLLQKLDHHSEKLKSPDFDSCVIENLQRMVMVLHGEISVKLKPVQRDICEQDARCKGTSGHDSNDSKRPYKTWRQLDYGAVVSSRYSEDHAGHPTSAVRSRVPYSDRGSDDIEPLPTNSRQAAACNTEEHSQGWLGRWTCGVFGTKTEKYEQLSSQSLLPDIQDTVPATSEQHRKKGQGCRIS